MNGEKKCECCRLPLSRKRYGRRLESLSNFEKRKFCSRSCANTRNEKTKEQKQHFSRKTITGAVSDIKSGNDEKRKTAIEFLEDIINDQQTDTITKVSAAKALLPYQATKTGTGGKKEDQQEKASKVANSGRFSPGPTPKIINIDGRRDKL